jgi:alpha-beta hydrolase superfamily lysophospholipase
MKSHERLSIDGETALHLFRWRPTTSPTALIVFSHGFLVPGFESHRLFLALAAEAVERGMEAVLFDYRGSGYSDLAFAEMTLDTEIADLHAVLDHVGSDAEADRPIFVWGQSLGSVVASHVVADRADVAGIVLWALSARMYERFAPRPGFRDLASGRATAVLDSGFTVGRGLLESMRGKDPYAALADMRAAKLFIHGDADDKAPVVIPGGGHAFKGQPELLAQASDTSFEWISRETSTRS